MTKKTKFKMYIFILFVLTNCFLFSQTPTPNEYQNIAIGKIAKASSIFTPDYGPEKAIDGNNATGWGSDTGDIQWIYVDLGSITEVNATVTPTISPTPTGPTPTLTPIITPTGNVIVVFGDSRTESGANDELEQQHYDIANSIIAENPIAVLSIGDYVNESDDDIQWNNFYSLYGNLFSNTPWYPASGGDGHDGDYNRWMEKIGIENNGIKYIITGGAGAGLNTVYPDGNTYGIWMAGSSSYHYCKLEIEHDKINVNVIDDSGLPIDNFVILPN